MSDVRRKILDLLSEGAEDACTTVIKSARGQLPYVRNSTQAADARWLIGVLLERADEVADDGKVEQLSPVDLDAARKRLIALRKQSA